jgi:hypothetical protein
MIIVPGYIAAGDITGVTAGVGLSGGGDSETVTLTLDLSELSAVTPTNGDSLSTLDSDGANEQLTTVASLATLFAGDGLAASSSVLGLDLVSNGGLEISSNKLQVATGISQYDVAQFAASVEDNDFLRIATTSVEGLSAAEVAAAIEGSIDAVGTIATGVWNGTAITGAYINDDIISGQAEITSGLDAADELLYSDAGTVKRVGVDTLTTYLAGINAGTVTSTGLSDSSGVISLDIANMTASSTIADADLIVIDDGAGGTLRKMTRANFIESAALDSINIDGGAIDGAVIGANSAANVTAAALVSTTFAPSDNVTIADSKGIIIESEPADDAYTGIYGNFANATGSTITKGQIVYMTGTANQVAPARANAAGTMPAVAMAIADVANGATGNFLMYGFAHDASAFISLTIGGEAYVSDTAAGALDATAPADDGEFVQIVGVGMHGDKLFFNPQLPMVEIA